MIVFLTFIFGIIIGFLSHVIAMKVNFMQRTIDNKIIAYDSLIKIWVKMRNKIYDTEETDTTKKWVSLDQLYGESQLYIGEIFLVSEDTKLSIEIDKLNESFYRAGWPTLLKEETNIKIDKFKTSALDIILRMREDVKESSALRGRDLLQILKGLSK